MSRNAGILVRICSDGISGFCGACISRLYITKQASSTRQSRCAVYVRAAICVVPLLTQTAVGTWIQVCKEATRAFAPSLEIHQLVRAGALEAVKVVVEAGASPNKPSITGSTPLMVAVMEATSSTVEMVKLLVRAQINRR